MNRRGQGWGWDFGQRIWGNALAVLWELDGQSADLLISDVIFRASMRRNIKCLDVIYSWSLRLVRNPGQLVPSWISHCSKTRGFCICQVWVRVGLSFFKKIFEGHQSFLWGQWYRCFRARMDRFTYVLYLMYAMDSSDSPLVWHLLTPGRPAWQLSFFDPDTCTWVYKHWWDSHLGQSVRHSVLGHSGSGEVILLTPTRAFILVKTQVNSRFITRRTPLPHHHYQQTFLYNRFQPIGD